MVNYFYDCYSILSKVYVEKSFLKQAILNTAIEEKNRSLTIKTCYGVLDKDIELSYYITKIADKNPKTAVRTILKISMYAVKYLGKHGYAVTQNAVELVKKLGKGGMSGFVNAFLRKFLQNPIDFPSERVERLSITYSFPRFAVKMLIEDYGESRAESIMASKNERACLVFDKENGEEYLKNIGVTFEKTPYENVFIAEKFVRNSDYDKGVYTFQSLGSVAVCAAVEGGKTLLDCCAAPGGKSINLAGKFETVTSWDIHSHRVELIKDYAKRMHVTNVFPCAKDAKIFDESLVESFDAVLCDAPCSGYGVVNDNPDIKLNREEKSLDELNVEQLAILKTVSAYVKKGGYLYYSTCSVFRRENIAILSTFMSDITGFEICNISNKLPCLNYGGATQYLPDDIGGGYFVAKLKKKERKVF